MALQPASEDDTIYLAHGEAILMSTGIDRENPESLHWMRLERE